MKKIIYLLALLSLIVSCKNEPSNALNYAIEDTDFPKLKFVETEHDFGRMQQGDEKETTFKFQNVGKGDLKITSISAKCGCTVPNDWPRELIPSGGVGEFKVKFNSRNKEGNIRQPITLTSNTENKTDVVTIVAQVVKN